MGLVKYDDDESVRITIPDGAGDLPDDGFVNAFVG